MSILEKTYQPKEIETAIYQRWESNEDFTPNEANEAYCIMIPPPNVTGSLHMGHAFQDTIMDLLIRYQRMMGKQALWQVGTDHAGIATQMLVERKLLAENTTRHDLGRDAFIDKVWQWKEQSGGQITQQLRRLGASIDWSRERFTMDEGLSDAVQHVFIQLYKEGLIYRGKRLVNWDPVLKTAISDLEVENKEEKGKMYHVRYPFVDKSITFGDGFMHIATTRPETILADGCLAVHPKDDRYRDVIGKEVHVPMTSRTIPIVADTYPDPDFGTGCVKITPAHDFNDYQVGQRHDIAIINLLNDDASLNDNAPERYQGLDRFVARKKIIADLEKDGYLTKIEEHTLMRPYGDRSGTVIEPYLTDQWYVKADVLAKPAMKAVKKGDIKFVPQSYENMFFSWMNDIQDWCISRQLWWGHRIPAWYDEQGNIYVAKDKQHAQQQAGENVTLKQDNDVLDTWFSSALWPFSTLGWPEKSKDLETYYPTNVLVTGFDIIFFWVARMMMMGLHFTQKVPFHTVYVTGLIRDEKGDKMSKSKGNVLDPIDLIDGIDKDTLVKKRTENMMQPKMAEKIAKRTAKQFPDGIQSYGTDAVRFTLASLATRGRDIRFDLERVEGYRNFCNKLWNVAKFVVMNTQDLQESTPSTLSITDQWIISRLQEIAAQVHQSVDQYRFDQMSHLLYHFIWDEYCAWYVEFSKSTLNHSATSVAQKNGAKQTLVKVLENILRLIHPIMPFISEQIWQDIKPITKATEHTIMHCPYPEADNALRNKHATEQVQWCQKIITAIRNIRGEMNISPSIELPILIENASTTESTQLAEHTALIKKLARCESIKILTAKEHAPECATALIGEMRLLIPLGAFIDAEAEIQRLQKEAQKIQQNIDNLLQRLNNTDFTDKAPATVIEKAQQQLTDSELRVAHLQQQIQKMQNLL